MDNRPVGVFDSGVGGLSVVKEIIQELPNEEIIYFGDTIRAPYGNLDQDRIAAYTFQIVQFLLSKNVKALVVACNTICAGCHKEFRELWDLPVPVIEVIEPGVEAALKSEGNSVLLLATQATVNSGLYQMLLRRRNPDLIYYEKACPDFVRLVEEGYVNASETYNTAQLHLQEYIHVRPDTVILGCTHFSLMKKAIEEALPANTAFADPSYGTARKLKKCLQNTQMIRSSSQKPRHQFYVSGKEQTCNFFLQSLFDAGWRAETVPIHMEKNLQFHEQ